MRWSSAWLLLGLAAGPASAASGSGEETELGYQKATGARVYARVVGDKLVLRSLGPSTSQVAYAIDLDGNGSITEADPYYTVRPDGSFCAGSWCPARKALDCRRASRAGGWQDTAGAQVQRRVEIPLDEAAPSARQLRLLLMMNKPEGGNATAWIGYDLVTGKVQALAGTAGTGTAAAPAAPAKPTGPGSASATTASGPTCPATTAALTQWLQGRRVLERKEEVKPQVVSGYFLPGSDGEVKYDVAGVTLLGARPLRMTAITHEGRFTALWVTFAGHDIKPFEPAFRAEFGQRKGKLTCNDMECRWQLVAYPDKAPKGVLGDVSISLYNLTQTESTLSCRYGD